MSINDNNNNPDGVGEEKTDIFGVSENVEAPKEQGTPKEEKKYAPIPDDHPTIASLKAEIEKISKDKESMGGNLSSQRTIIENLQKQVELLSKGGNNNASGGNNNTNKQGEGNSEGLLFNEIKFSKDLSADEKDEMTDTELKQFDEIATLKQALNNLNQNINKIVSGKEEKKEAVDLNTIVRETAKELSKDEAGKENTEIANLIIENSKMFNYEGLTEEQIKERVLASAKLIPNYQPPKENTTKRGNAVKSGTGKAEDPFGIDTIVEEATKGNTGSYTL